MENLLWRWSLVALGFSAVLTAALALRSHRYHVVDEYCGAHGCVVFDRWMHQQVLLSFGEEPQLLTGPEAALAKPSTTWVSSATDSAYADCALLADMAVVIGPDARSCSLR